LRGPKTDRSVFDKDMTKNTVPAISNNAAKKILNQNAVVRPS